MNVVNTALAVFFGFASGTVIAGGVFGLIAMIGIVPRLAQKTGTEGHVIWYEEMIMAGGIFGAFNEGLRFSFGFGGWVGLLWGFAGGVFFGCLAMSLAEVLDVIPILTRRMRVQRGMFLLILAIALGKLAGSLMYFIVPGFYEP